MKDFVKLTKETWQFYLTALCISLLPVVSNNIYVLKQLESNKSNRDSLFFLAEIFFNKADWYDLVNFCLALFGIVILLLAKHVPFMDSRTMEFQTFWPVRKQMTVIHDYILSLGVLIILWMITICMLGVAQNTHNHAVLAVNGMLREEALRAGQELFHAGSCYLLYLVLAYNLLYLGIVICKNCIAGMACMVAVWGIVYMLEEVIYQGGSLFAELLMPSYFFQRIYNTQNERDGIWILAGIAVFLFLLILLAGGRRELSRGKWFYFPVLDYAFSVMCGFFAILLCDCVFEFMPLFCVAAGIAVCGFFFFLQNRDGYKAAENWEVK